MTINLSKPFQTYLCALGLLAIMALGASCHTPRKAAKTAESKSSKTTVAPGAIDLSPDNILSRLKQNAIQYNTFSAKAKLNINTPKTSQKGITTYIRMQKDSAIWVSVRPVLGIELVRVLITPDSVKMINFFKKTLTVAGVDSLQQLLHIPYDFAALQNLLLGNPLFLSSPEQITANGDTIAFSCTDGNLVSHFQLAAANFLVQTNKLTIVKDTGAPRYSVQKFDDYQDIQGQQFSLKRALDIHSPEAARVEIIYNHVDFKAPVSFPFPEPAGFKRN